MFEPFPYNYSWNLAINCCLAMGAPMGEIDPVNTVLRDASLVEDRGTEAFFRAYGKLADHLMELGHEEREHGYLNAASRRYLRAVAYYVTAERIQNRHYEPRREMYQRMRNALALAIESGALNCEAFDIPFEGVSFPALFIRGNGNGPRPCVVFCNGLDSVKEMAYLVIRDEFARRGISMLLVDQPGTGGALRLQGLPAVVEAERWAGAAVDYLETRPDVDRSATGMAGWSLGGYYAPRAACYEKRFSFCVAWGANHDWGEMQQRRLKNEGDRPVPHYWDHVMWVWGKNTLAEFIEFAPLITLEGHLGNLTVPFLVVHGERDRQIPVEYAHKSFQQAVNSPKRHIRIFTERDGAVEHCGLDNVEPVIEYIADYVAAEFCAGASMLEAGSSV